MYGHTIARVDLQTTGFDGIPAIDIEEYLVKVDCCATGTQIARSFEGTLRCIVNLEPAKQGY